MHYYSNTSCYSAFENRTISRKWRRILIIILQNEHDVLWKEYPQSPQWHVWFIFPSSSLIRHIVHLHSKCKYSIKHWSNPRRSAWEKGRVSVWKHQPVNSLKREERSLQRYKSMMLFGNFIQSEWVSTAQFNLVVCWWRLKERESTNLVCAVYLFVDSIAHRVEMSYAQCRLSNFDIYWFFRSWLQKQTIFNEMENIFFCRYVYRGEFR